MNEALRAALLGVIQALTEFLPVSSSAHIALLRPILGDHEASLTLDVGLHAGTAAAVVLFFWRDWMGIARQALGDLRLHGLAPSRWSPSGRLALLLAAATVPAVIVGGLFGDVIEERLREPTLIATMLLLGALAMGVADRWGSSARGLNRVSIADALVIGCCQAVALIPGVSRSGITITAGRALGFDRETAVRFSFLLSMPVIVGAVTQQGLRAMDDPQVSWGILAIGATTSLVVGLVVIRFLLKFVTTATLMPFVWYRIALAAVILGSLVRTPD